LGLGLPLPAALGGGNEIATGPNDGGAVDVPGSLVASLGEVAAGSGELGAAGGDELGAAGGDELGAAGGDELAELELGATGAAGTAAGEVAELPLLGAVGLELAPGASVG